MMKKTLITFLLVTFGICYGQNLVPNGDFEIGPDSSSGGWWRKIQVDCFAPADSLAGPDFWSVTVPSPDRMVEGRIYCQWNNDTAQSGKSYIVEGYGEEGKATLIYPLEQDSMYLLSYHLRMETFNGAFTLPCAVNFNFNNGGNSIFSPTNNNPFSWQHYDTIFKASSNSTEIGIIGASVAYSASDIDNVSITKISETGIFEYAKKNINVFPNPFYNSLNIIVKDNQQTEIIIYDFSSRKLLQQTFINSTTLNTEQLGKGMYLYEVKNRNGIIKNGRVIKE